jgi:glutamate dehydrogenase
MVANSGTHWHAALCQRIIASILPGEAALAGPQLDDAADFLLEAAQYRAPGQPSILIRSATGQHRVTRIAVVNRDVPFLVASISHALAAHGLSVDLLVHPVLPVVRDDSCQLAALPDDGSGVRESFIYLETDRIDARQRRALEADLAATIADVRAAVADWPQLRDAIAADAATLADPEGTALLTWLGEGMMTQLGHTVRHRDGSKTERLGICRQSNTPLLAEASWKRAFAWFDDAENHHAPLVVKANRLSLVHRRVPIDLFIVPVLVSGAVTALSVHAGIWTSAALSAAPDSVPILRRQLQAITAALGIAPDGHDHKSLIHALSVLPHDLVISFTADDTLRVVTAMMALIDRPRPRVALVAAPLERHVFAFVWLPRDLLSTTVRQAIQALLESATGTATLDWSLSVEGGNLAMLRYVLDARKGRATLDPAAIDAALQDMLRGWIDAVEAALATTEEPGRAAALAMRHAPAFPAAYRASYGAAEAARDIARLRHLDGGQGRELGRDARLYRHDADLPDQLRLKVYQAGGSLPLSDAVPALENFGFQVMSELPTMLAAEQAGEPPSTIHDFLLGLPAGSDTAGVLHRAAVIERAIAAVLNQQADDDLFNQLVVHGQLAAPEAEWLRAIYRYLRQTNVAFTIRSVVDALAGAGPVTHALIDLFKVRHDPAFAQDRTAATAATEGAIRAGLANVGAINDDRILRLYWQVILAVLRTNVFAPAGRPAGGTALAFKFDSSLVPGLPKPVPWREIFVYSRRVEGIHLRAGPVARGGLRWSDRRDDFRTEVLGLMKAQRVKNAVIVPTGAKGGFYPKCLPNPALDREGWATEGRESYRVFIAALLSVTDNIVDGTVVHPASVVVHDGQDPYFVVAADKGTATFSDTANAIALEHGFWLGDAFASGGSNGYDHKAMGITARGAWLSVQRHFAEMGVDVQADPVRVVGCGDMSGDVFGNGMLLSKAIKLVAAFDHRHIFIDPDPDPASSWAERQRLFNLPRSSWADYSADLLSKGGGIFPRSLKQIALSDEARAALDIADSALDPESLISAILKSQVDLIWFGGIGTYVKAAGESHADVGDPANDGLRINGDDVGANVIGEGANLGVTQAGRIEFGLAGGRINTDFIDNSAGVDCSDNEVNIKIALGTVAGLDPARRNALLAEMTDAVAALVLEDNRLQALALSIAQGHGAPTTGAYVRLIETLEESGALDRRTEGLAGNDVLARRAAEGHGLTRPELAALLSNAKLALQDALEHGDLAQTAAAEALLLDDFPPQLQRDYRPALLAHRLAPQIVATVVANQMVNRMGMIHPFELAEEEGAGLAAIGSAFVTACDLLNMHALWRAIDAATMPEAARLMLFDAAAVALRGHMADLLRSGVVATDQIGAAMANLSAHADSLLGSEARGQIAAIVTRLEQAGAPAPLAVLVGSLYAQDGAIGLAALAQDTGLPPVEVAEVFVGLGALLGIDWAQARAALMSPADPWDRLLVAGLARDFQAMRFDFLRVLAANTPASGLQQAVEAWASTAAAPRARLNGVIARARGAAVLTPAMLAQVAGQARNLLQH